MKLFSQSHGFHFYCHYSKCKRRFGKWLIFWSFLNVFGLLFVYCLFRWNIICSNSMTQTAIDNLCAAYSQGNVYGSLCSPLCVDGEIELVTCHPMHKGKNVVFTAQWRNENVVIKSHKSKDEYIPLHWRNENGTSIFPSPEEFIEMITHSLETNCGLTYNQSSNIIKTLFPYVEIPSVLSNDLMINLWQLIQDNEYVMSIVFENHHIFPRVLGSCGTFYAVEYASPILVPESVTDLRSQVRAFARLMGKLETLAPEALEVCDVKTEHFGWSREGLLRILDADTVFVKSLADRFVSDGRDCRSDRDCNLFDCHSTCNRESNRCDRPIVNTNRERICRKIIEDPELCI